MFYELQEKIISSLAHYSGTKPPKEIQAKEKVKHFFIQTNLVVIRCWEKSSPGKVPSEWQLHSVSVTLQGQPLPFASNLTKRKIFQIYRTCKLTLPINHFTFVSDLQRNYKNVTLNLSLKEYKMSCQWGPSE